ncbi:hypothetical protein ABPG74_010747 [Tetrahymena malaccensis]
MGHLAEAVTISEQKKFALAIVLIEIFCVIIHGCVADYDNDTDLPDNAARYPMWQDINVMIFVGFGFLMTFLRTYQFSAVGYTFVIGAVSFQLYPIWEAIWKCAFDLDAPFKIHFNTLTLMTSSFCAGAILITFGGIIGKVSGFQMVVCIFFETIGFTLNERISINMGVADIGGSMVIHTYGAVFGLILAKMLSPRSAFSHKKAESNYISDLTSFIGTIFLYMYWPSFNAGPATPGSQAQNRAYINTMLSLSASCMVTFLISLLTRSEDKKFNMIDIQNATLAGGVAMGTCASMNILPVWAILIGALAGIISTLGFSKLQPFLESKIGLHDTCGIMNLHCMPGILGGVWGCVAAAKASSRGDTVAQLLDVYPKANQADWSQSKQGGIQVAFLFITIGIAFGSAIFTGFMMKLLGNTPTQLFEDGESYHIPRIRFEDPEEIITKIPKMPHSQVLLVTEQNGSKNNIDGEKIGMIELQQNGASNTISYQTSSAVKN